MKKVIFSFIFLIYSGNLLATPEFAREQSASCSVCHTNIPTLNDTGEIFLRNGFRFSSEDETTLNKTLEGKVIPLAVMLRESYSSLSEDDSQKIKLYSAGSITKNLSFFAVSQEVFNSNDNSNSPSFFEEKSSRAYLQLNLQNDTHVIRAGLMNPYTMFGNLSKIYSDSGLNGGGGSKENGNSQSHSGGNSTNSMRAKNQDNSHGQNNAQGNNSQEGNSQGNMQGSRGFGNSNYKTPLNNSSFSKYKGIEYSYLYNSKMMFLFSYGKPIDENSDSKGNSSNTEQNSIDTDDEYQFISAIRYYMDNGFKIGVLYNLFQKGDTESYSMIFPLEKTFDNFTIALACVYKNNDKTNDYIGFENAFVYSIDDTSQIKAIFNMDEDENYENNYAYSLSYSKMFMDKFLLRVIGAKKDTSDSDDEYIEASISLFL